jgi:hypothetical protein
MHYFMFFTILLELIYLYQNDIVDTMAYTYKNIRINMFYNTLPMDIII